MTSHHPSEIDSTAGDSVTSSPRSDYNPHDLQPRVRFMCSFGGQILPRPHDSQLRYVGGDTRIVAVNRSTSFSSLLTKLSKLSNNTDITVKYQLPNEDLDALISVTTDEDVENMMEEYDRLVTSGNAKTARLRLFLFSTSMSRTSSVNSLLDGSRREHWFFDALNGGSASGAMSLERGRSEVSSIVSEVPDFLFGLDHMDESRESREGKVRNRHVMMAENVSVSDPGSPAPVVSSSPYCSTTSIPDLPPVKTKIETLTTPVVELRNTQVSETGEHFMTQQTGYSGSSTWHYVPEPQYPNPASLQPMPVYYVPGSNVPVQVQRVPVQAPYIQQYPVPVTQVPVGYRPQMSGMGPVYGGGMRPVNPVDGYEYPVGMMQDGVSQNVYYGGRNAAVVPGYQAGMVPVGAEMQGGGGMEMKINKVNQPHS